MTRSSRRRRLTALLLLLCQGAVLALGAVAAHAAQQLPAGEIQSVAQATMPAAKGIPAEVVQWFDAMKEAADKGDGAKALQMHQKVQTWVQANLPEKHVFRARVLVRYGYVLDKIERYQEALIPTREGAQMLRELAKIDPDPDTSFFFTVALLNLGRRYTRLDQQQAAMEAYQEAWPHLLQQVKASDSNLIFTAVLISQLGDEFAKLQKHDLALTAYQQALSVVSDLAKVETSYVPYVADLQIKLGQTYRSLNQYNPARVAVQSAIFSLRDQLKRGLNAQGEIARSLWILGDIQLELNKIELALEAYKEALIVLSRTLKDRAKKDNDSDKYTVVNSGNIYKTRAPVKCSGDLSRYFATFAKGGETRFKPRRIIGQDNNYCRKYS